MSEKRKVEIFSAGCPVCQETVEMVKRISCESCDVTILDMKNSTVAERAKNLGIKSVPAVVVDGNLAGCCAGRGPDETILKSAGIGTPLP